MHSGHMYNYISTKIFGLLRSQFLSKFYCCIILLNQNFSNIKISSELQQQTFIYKDYINYSILGDQRICSN